MNHLEDDEQAALFQWAAHYPVLQWMHSVPNGGNRKPREAARLKRQGVRSGVYDIFLPLPVGVYHGLYVEMKRSKGQTRVTTNQREFGAYAASHGYLCAICYGTEEAIEVIKDYAKI